MNTGGIYITMEYLASLPQEEQDFVFDLLRGQAAASTRKPPSASDATAVTNDGHFAELSPGQAREFYAGCGLKTQKAIATIVAGSSRQFQLADVAKALEVPAGELRGVWGGLTRRVKTITGDEDAYLIDWVSSEAEHDSDGNYIDHQGALTELTYRSFRKVLGQA